MANHLYTIELNSTHFEVKISPTTNYGYFEHFELGDECGGGLWFDDNKTLVDQDGTSYLPRQVARLVREAGYTVPPEYNN